MPLYAMRMAFSVNIMRSAKDTKRSGHARNESGLAVTLPPERLCGGYMNANRRILPVPVAVIQHHVLFPYSDSFKSQAISLHILLVAAGCLDSDRHRKLVNAPTKQILFQSPRPIRPFATKQLQHGFRMACTDPYARRPALGTS